MTTQGLDHPDVQDDREVIKKEIVEEEELDHQDYEWATPDQTPKSKQLNSILPQLSDTNTNTTSTPLPFSQHQLGKRKRSTKIKEILSEIKNNKKKNPLASNSKPVIPNLSGKRVRCKQEKNPIIGLNSPGQVKSPAMVRAEEVRLNLGPESPSFLKLLVRSHVVTGFWMSLPVPFCKLHLPKKDAMVILEDESGEQFELKYIVEKTGLSAGWKKFAVGHQLLEGDVLVFHLVGQDKFKVYIIRANDLTDVDGALSLLNLDAISKQINATDKEDRPAPKPKRRKRPNTNPSTSVGKKNKKTGLTSSVLQVGQPVEQSGNDSEVGSEILEGSKFSESTGSFKDIKCFEDFHITVNGLCIDAELPKHMRLKYYELCKSRSAYLHDRVLSGLYSKLVAGIIGETVNIADAIRECNFTTSRDEIALWEKSLKSFALLGMNVGFMRNRIRRLLSLAFESEGASETRRYIEAKTERIRVEDEIMNLEAKLVELKEATERCGADIESLKPEAERYELKFREEINAPW
ncbi:hypothetical protein LguiB_019453 [Lonicera macranthoides]